MNPTQSQLHESNTCNDENQPSLTDLWLKADPIRWVAGLMAGVFATVIMMIATMGLCVLFGKEAWFVIKFMATPFLGYAATDAGFHLLPILMGFVLLTALFGFWGVVFGHFVRTNKIPALLGMGFTWAAFSWIFLNNLFAPAFPVVFNQTHQWSGAAFFVLLIYGLNLTSIRFFDSILRK